MLLTKTFWISKPKIKNQRLKLPVGDFVAVDTTWVLSSSNTRSERKRENMNK